MKTLPNETVQCLIAADYRTLSAGLPDTIEKAIDQPPVSMLIAATSKQSVQAAIEFELILLSTLVSTGGNLTSAQVPFVASQLILQYPNESLADFKLCFQRGATGLYGEIQRLDGVTIGVWMKEHYLPEKYQVKEDLLMKEKDNPYQPFEVKEASILPADHHKRIPISIEQAEPYLQQMLESIKSVEAKKISPLSPEEILQEGREKPKKREYRPFYDEKHRDAHIAYYRKTNPGATPQEIETWLNLIKNGNKG